MPSGLLYKLAGLYEQTLLAQTKQQKRTIEEEYRIALAAVDAYVRSTESTHSTLITYYSQGLLFSIKRVPFHNALIETPYQLTVINQVHAAFGKARFRQVLATILQYVDSLHVPSNPQVGKRPHIDIDTQWQRVIDEALKPAPPVPTEHTAQQARETVTLKPQAIVQSVSASRPHPVPPSIPTVAAQPPVSAKPARPAIELNQQEIVRLQEESEHLRERLTVEDEEAQPVAPIVARPQPAAHVQEEHVMDTISIAPASMKEEKTDGSVVEIDEDWQTIVQRWRPEHWEIIRLLYQKQETQLVTIERRVHYPLSQLIDEINDPVNELLADLLIESEPYTLAPHLQEQAGILVHWYVSSREREGDIL
jgi:hypothetical protein